MAKRKSARGSKTAKGKASDKGGTEEKLSFVRNRRRKVETKTKLARRLTPDQITVVGIQLDIPGQGRINIGGRGAANSWDSDLSDAKVDSDPTDQFFDMDGSDGINDMDPTDPLRRGGGGGPIIIA